MNDTGAEPKETLLAASACLTVTEYDPSANGNKGLHDHDPPGPTGLVHVVCVTAGSGPTIVAVTVAPFSPPSPLTVTAPLDNAAPSDGTETAGAAGAVESIANDLDAELGDVWLNASVCLTLTEYDPSANGDEGLQDHVPLDPTLLVHVDSVTAGAGPTIVAVTVAPVVPPVPLTVTVPFVSTAPADGAEIVGGVKLQ
nr:hypothetical protein [Actinoplanes consettensis]